MRHFRIRLATAMLAAVVVLIAVPAVASANTVWVSGATPSTPFNSCAHPGYKHIQQAIEAPTTAIHVCPGTYEEQLQINRALTVTGETGAIVQLPASPAVSTSSCAAAGEQDLVGICGKAKEAVKISGLTFEAYWPENTCKEELYGINVGGGVNLTLSNSVMLGAGAKPVNGCQGGVGVQIGRHFTAQVATATLINDKISGYQKNGITVDNTESKATIQKVEVTGAGPAPIAQNGIQVSRGAVARITEATITKNECNTAEVPTCGNGSYLQLEEDGAGVLLYKDGTGTQVTKSHINENDLGVSNISEAETTKAQATISSDTLEGDRYAAVMLGQGYASIGKDTMTSGAVGILLLQYWDTLEWPPAQEFGPRGSGSEDTISGMSKYAIEGLSDNEPNDQFGSFTITKSKISENPGPTPKESVFSNNPGKLKIVTNSTDS